MAAASSFPHILHPRRQLAASRGQSCGFERTLCERSLQQRISETKRRSPAWFSLFRPWLYVCKTQLNFVPRVLCGVFGWAVRPSCSRLSDLVASWFHREECSSLSGLRSLNGFKHPSLSFRFLICITRVQRHAKRNAAKRLLAVLCTPYVHFLSI